MTKGRRRFGHTGLDRPETTIVESGTRSGDGETKEGELLFIKKTLLTPHEYPLDQSLTVSIKGGRK